MYLILVLEQIDRSTCPIIVISLNLKILYFFFNLLLIGGFCFHITGLFFKKQIFAKCCSLSTYYIGTYPIRFGETDEEESISDDDGANGD